MFTLSSISRAMTQRRVAHFRRLFTSRGIHWNPLSPSLTCSPLVSQDHS